MSDADVEKSLNKVPMIIFSSLLSIECSSTTPKVIATTNQSRDKYHLEPLKLIEICG